MTNIVRLSSSLPQKVGANLTQILLENSNSDDNAIELTISIEAEDLGVKDFSSYLDLIYRIDGNLSLIGYKRYVQVPKDQIRIAEIRFGSIEVVIERFINSLDANNIAIIGLCLKYLPQVFKATMEVGTQYYEIQNKREDYLEKKDKRKLRKSIRESITRDENLKGINKNLKEKIVDLLDDLYGKNLIRMNSSSRFANKSVKSIKLKTKRKNSS